MLALGESSEYSDSFMNVSATTYERIATLLWAIVGLFAGLTLGGMLGLSGRHTLFLVVLVTGAIVLVRINQRIKHTAPPASLPSGDKQLLPATTKSELTPRPAEVQQDDATVEPTTRPEPAAAAAPAIIPAEGPLSPEDARQWLDELLTKQQR